MPIEPGIPLNKEEVFKRITEEEIFEKYLQLPIDEDTFYTNPLRPDKRAGCRYYRNKNGRLYFKDFSKGFHWDCFNVVQVANNNCTFIDALRIIIRDFKLNTVIPGYEIKHEEVFKLRTKIQISVRAWNNQDAQYWNQYGIGLSTLSNFRVYACNGLWFNGEYYKCKANDPCYAYYFGNDIFKLYFPFRETNRFLQNTNYNDNILQGWNQLKRNTDTLIITKSLKDVMVYYLFGIEAIAPISENQIITPEQYAEISNIYRNIYTNADNDSTGRNFMVQHQIHYGIPYIVFPKTFKKDISDNVKHLGFDHVKQIVNHIKDGIS